MTATQNRVELAKRIAHAVSRVAEYTEGSRHATEIAANSLRQARRDLDVLIASVDDRLESIPRV